MNGLEILEKLDKTIILPENYYFGVACSNNFKVILFKNDNDPTGQVVAEYKLENDSDSEIARLGLMLESIFANLEKQEEQK